MAAIQSALLTEQVYRRLLDGIFGGRWPADAKLVETTVARALGVSRTPVREAFARLTDEGFLAYAPRRGRRVRSISRKDVNDLYELRAALERLAFRMAGSRISPPDIRRLRARTAPLRPAPGDTGQAAALEADDELHELFCRRCGNRYLEDYLRRLIRLSRPFRCFGAESPARGRTLQAQRRRIVEALAAGRLRTAEACLVRHIREGQQAILARLEARAGAR